MNIVYLELLRILSAYSKELLPIFLEQFDHMISATSRKDTVTSVYQ